MGVVEVRNEVIAQLRASVEGLTELDDGGVIFPTDSTRVFVDVVDWHALDKPLTIVKVTAIALFDVPGSPELFEQIATKAADNPFGTISLSPISENLYNVGVTHNLVGETMQGDDLATATASVIGVAEMITEWLKHQYGGRRWADL